MMRPAQVTLAAFRNLIFTEQFVFDGLSLTGVVMAMQVRPYPDAPDDPLIDLGMASAGSEGISTLVDTSGPTPISTVTVQIDRSSLQSIAGPPNPGGDVVLAYDLVTTGVNFGQVMLVRGAFILQGSVTRP